MKRLIKMFVSAMSVCICFPLALISGFGRVEILYTLGAHSVAILPGLIGDYLRTAFYFQTLDACPLNVRISFGALFAQSSVRIGDAVYVGAYCVIGRSVIGSRTQIASHVQVLSGSRQHGRDAAGHLMGANLEEFTPISIGADCWLGAGTIVMADVGDRSTIGAGAVVTRAVPSDCTAVGNPARALDRVS